MNNQAKAVISQLEKPPFAQIFKNINKSQGHPIFEMDAELLAKGLRDIVALFVADTSDHRFATLDQLENQLVSSAKLGSQNLTIILSELHKGTPKKLKEKWFLASLDSISKVLVKSSIEELRQYIINAINPRAFGLYQSDGSVPDSMFFGRRNEVSDISDSERSFVYYGARRIGKSSFANRVFRVLGSNIGSRHSLGKGSAKVEYASSCLIDLHGLDSPSQLWRAILDHMGFQTRDLIPGARFRASLTNRGEQVLKSDFEILQAILRREPNQRALLMFDEVDVVIRRDRQNDYEVFAKLQGLVDDERCNLRIVLLGYEDLLRAHETDKFPLNHTRTRSKSLGPLHERDVKELIAVPMGRINVSVEHADEVAREVSRATGGAPNLVQDLCSCILRLDSVNESRTVTIRDVVEAMNHRDFRGRIEQQFEQVEEPLPRLIAYLMAGWSGDFRLEDVLDRLQRSQLPIDDRQVRQALAQLKLYNIVHEDGTDEFVFASDVLQQLLLGQLEKDRNRSRIKMLCRKITWNAHE